MSKMLKIIFEALIEQILNKNININNDSLIIALAIFYLAETIREKKIFEANNGSIKL